MSGLTQALGYQQDVKVGVIDVFEAPLATTYNDTTGAWMYLGVVEPGSFKADMSRKIFDFKSGVPETIKASFPIDINGKVSFNMVEISELAFQIAAGGVSAIYSYDTGSTTFTASPGQATANGATSFAITSATGFAVGDYCELQTTINSTTGTEYAYITAIVGTTITVMPALRGTVVASTGTFKQVKLGRVPVGTSTIRQKTYRFLFSATDNSQVILHILQARADGVKPEFPQGKNSMIPISLEAFGVVDNTLTPPQPVVAQAYYLPPNSTGKI